MNKLESSGQNRLKRGDTIIEVIFAVAVFAVVSVAAMMIMNKGLDKTPGSLELGFRSPRRCPAASLTKR